MSYIRHTGMDINGDVMSEMKESRKRVSIAQKTDIKLRLLEKILIDKTITADRYKSIRVQVDEAVYLDELNIIIEIANS